MLNTIVLIDDKDFTKKKAYRFLKRVRKELCSSEFVDDNAELIVLSQNADAGAWQGETLHITNTADNRTIPQEWAEGEGIIENLLAIDHEGSGIFVLCDYELEMFGTLIRGENHTLERVIEVVDALEMVAKDSTLILVIYSSVKSLEAKDDISKLSEHIKTLKNVKLITQVLMFYDTRPEDNIPSLREFLLDNQVDIKREAGINE